MIKRFKVMYFAIIMAILSISITPAVYSSADNQSEPVPLKLICALHGADIKWDQKTATASVFKGKNVLKVVRGSNKAIVNGRNVTLKSPVKCINDRITVPLYIVNSAFGTNYTLEECLKKLSVKYLEYLRNENFAECSAFYNNTLKQLLLSNSLKQMAATYKSLGDIKQESITVSKNGVHINISIRYSAKTSEQCDYIFRYDYSGFMDDIILLPVIPSDPYKTPEYDKPGNYTEKELVIGSGEWKLPGTLTIPKGNGPFPVIILVHGSGANDRDESLGPLKPFRDIAAGLAAKNIAVFRYEKRTLEHNLKYRFVNKATVKEEMLDDVFAAADFLSKQKIIDPSAIFVLGHSQGGLYIPEIMSDKNSKLFKGAVIMSGPSRFMGDITVQQYEYLMNLGMATKEQYDYMKAQIDIIKSSDFSPDNPPKDFYLGEAYWWADMKAYNPTETARGVSKPMLILQGERDYQVTAKEDFKGWKDSLAGKENVSFKLYPKLNHMYTEGEGQCTPMEYLSKQANIPPYVIEDIAQWVNEAN